MNDLTGAACHVLSLGRTDVVKAVQATRPKARTGVELRGRDLGSQQFPVDNRVNRKVQSELM